MYIQRAEPGEFAVMPSGRHIFISFLHQIFGVPQKIAALGWPINPNLELSCSCGVYNPVLVAIPCGPAQQVPQDLWNCVDAQPVLRSPRWGEPAGLASNKQSVLTAEPLVSRPQSSCVTKIQGAPDLRTSTRNKRKELLPVKAESHHCAPVCGAGSLLSRAGILLLIILD